MRRPPPDGADQEVLALTPIPKPAHELGLDVPEGQPIEVNPLDCMTAHPSCAQGLGQDALRPPPPESSRGGAGLDVAALGEQMAGITVSAAQQVGMGPLAEGAAAAAAGQAPDRTIDRTHGEVPGAEDRIWLQAVHPTRSQMASLPARAQGSAIARPSRIEVKAKRAKAWRRPALK